MTEITTSDLQILLKTWTTDLIKYVPTLLGIIALYYAGRYIICFITRLVKRIMKRCQVDLALQNFLLQVVRQVLYTALFLAVVQVIGLPATQFIAIITSGFVAIGLALRGSLSNFVSDIMILIFKPFRVSDTMEANGQKGTVRNIGLFATTLSKPNNEEAIIPNTQPLGNSIINYSREEERRVYVLVGIGYSSSTQKARGMLLEIARQEPLALKDPEPVVYVEALADSSINLSLRYWCMNADYFTCCFRTLGTIRERFDAVGVEISFPQVQVYQ